MVSVWVRRADCPSRIIMYISNGIDSDYSCKLDVIVRGFGGYNTRVTKHFISHILKNEAVNSKIELMTVFFGTNDACTNADALVSIDDYQENLRYITGQIKSIGTKPIIIGPTLHGGTDPSRSSTRNLQYSEAAKKVSQELEVPFVDLWHAFASTLGYKEGDIHPGEKGGANCDELFVDGIHFSSQGYKILYNELLKTIETHYPKLHFDNIPSHFPLWETVKKDIPGFIDHGIPN
ncbi:Iah1p [Sugiyamaella lignohabitans]|uniref:Iah1p n=1 Tax=Sugiyamaella lignohabitans TaxID=796027 RepID=A0A167DA11_9ASCO|nr:Iah1p [Sugiyamaella lignohabitans]ANB12663.1 Iah1p [Sugiyamaella lignohabitans]